MKLIICAVLFFLCTTPVYCQYNTKSIDSLLRTYYKENEPGAFVLISQNNQPIFKKGYGLANLQTKEKISSHTNFNIGSLTKQFTAFCIVQLAAKKQLSLQDKLIKYFPGFNHKTGNLITIQQLLTHSSGIIDHYAFTDTSLVKHATDKDVLNAVKNIDSTYFIPGTRYRYSNTAYCLLAMIIEKISGMSYNDYINKNIFMPLSMQHAVVLQTGKPVYNQAFGYDYDGSKNAFSKLDADEAIFFSTEGDGGIYTSADEYLHWYHSLQQPLPVNSSIVQKCRSPQFKIDSLNRLSYGYGWFVSEKDSIKAVYHTGSNGGFRAIVFTVPSKNYLVTIFSNRTGIDLEKMVQQINEILGVTNNSFTKVGALVSFINSSPIFAACKEII
ncbi:MAG TPA: serine hydrolase domain-containing protein [Chitinophagaceae bacterium]|nr:serine hydrolase domain-containing protein [Chitinophagaceae bacterium]